MEFWNETKPVAKVEHKCDACGHPILAGEQYSRMAGKDDGWFFTAKQHLECRAAECALADADRLCEALAKRGGKIVWEGE